MEKEAKKLNGKDLIQIGIYAAIYYVIVCVVAMLGMIPVMYPMLADVCVYWFAFGMDLSGRKL